MAPNPAAGVVPRSPTERVHKAWRRRPFTVFEYAMLAMVLVVADGPLAWIAVNSFKPESEIYAYPPTLLPIPFTLDNFHQLFVQTSFGSFLLNSSIVSIATTVLTLVVGTIGAYAFARFAARHLYLRALSELSLVAYMLPAILLVVPISLIVTQLGLVDLTALVVVYTATLLPFALWILRSYFFGVSVELEEAAMVDGCTRFGAFRHVVLPQAAPGIISTGIFVFNTAWQEYLFASILLSGNPDTQTLSIGVAALSNLNNSFVWGILMAASVVMTVPVIVLFMLAQRQLVGGLTVGAVKG